MALLTLLSPFVRNIHIDGKNVFIPRNDSIEFLQNNDGTFRILIINNDIGKLNMVYRCTEKVIYVINDFREDDDETHRRERLLIGNKGGDYEGTDNEYYEILIKVIKENYDAITAYFNI